MTDFLEITLDTDTCRRYVPTQEEEDKVRNAMAFLVIKAPFFAHVLYNDTPIIYTLEVPYGATDGVSCLLNPQGFHDWDIPTVAFLIAHEIGHKIFLHCYLMTKFRADKFVTVSNGRQLPYDQDLMNKAMDYMINAMLIEARIGSFPKIGLFDPDISAKGMESCIEIYEKLFDACGGQPGKLRIRIGRGAGGGESFDIHIPMKPGKAQKHEAKPEKHDMLIAAAALAQENSKQGNMPAAVQVLVGEIMEPKVSWQEHLRTTCMRNAGDPAYDWRSIDRRLIVRPNPMYFAKMRHTGVNCVVIMDDTSGSVMNDKIQGAFFSEMCGIVADLAPAQLVIIWCDAEVGRVDELEEPEDLLELHKSVQATGVQGGGGTDFRPAFNKVAEMELEPDLCVYLTDTEGTFPAHVPDYPVVWCSIKKDGKVPWGDLVHVEL